MPPSRPGQSRDVALASHFRLLARGPIPYAVHLCKILRGGVMLLLLCVVVVVVVDVIVVVVVITIIIILIT